MGVSFPIKINGKSYTYNELENVDRYDILWIKKWTQNYKKVTYKTVFPRIDELTNTYLGQLEWWDHKVTFKSSMYIISKLDINNKIGFYIKKVNTFYFDINKKSLDILKLYINFIKNLIDLLGNLYMTFMYNSELEDGTIVLKGKGFITNDFFKFFHIKLLNDLLTKTLNPYSEEDINQIIEPLLF